MAAAGKAQEGPSSAAIAAVSVPVEVDGSMALHVRIPNISRSRAFACWTNPKEMREWFAPRVFTVVECTFEARVGGRSRVVMRGPDCSQLKNMQTSCENVDLSKAPQKDYPCHSTVTEIKPDEHLQMIGELDDDEQAGPQRILQSVDFSNEPDGACLINVRSQIPKSYHGKGIKQGWMETLQRLYDYLTAHPETPVA